MTSTDFSPLQRLRIALRSRWQFARAFELEAAVDHADLRRRATALDTAECFDARPLGSVAPAQALF